jgi:hypothetical protein
MTRQRLSLTLVPLLSLALPAGAAEEAKDPRPDLEAAQAVLDQAVAEVSRPSVHVVLGGREAARGYRVKGVGAIFVLPPRALPHPERERVMIIGRRSAPGPGLRRLRGRELEMRAIQQQAETLQREAEAAQREAERAFEEFEHNVIRLVTPADPAAPLPPEPPQQPEAPTPASAPAPLPPPWAHWFDSGEPADGRTAERVIADVEAAVTSALGRLGPRLGTLSGDEAVLVAVDFLPARGFEFIDAPGTPTRSLIVKARKKDLVERGLGKITAEELRRRIDVTQY